MPSTSCAACRIDARITAPESTTVPSRSKRTTGNRISMMLATPVGHADEIQAPRGRGRAGLAAGPALEELCDPLRRQFHHRPDERPHHVTEKRVGRDPELEHVASAVPGGGYDLSEQHAVLCVRRREATKVVLADKVARRLIQRLDVRRTSQPPRAA